MKNVKVSDTRNFALIGHSGDGKTSLGEAHPARCRRHQRLGKVNDGSSSLNHLPRRRSAVEHHLVDLRASTGRASTSRWWTPRGFELPGDGQIALRALDGAVLLVVSGRTAPGSAPSACGALAGTRWHPDCVAFVNGHGPRSGRTSTRPWSRCATIGAGAAVVTLPIGSEDPLKRRRGPADMKGHVTLLGEGEIPADLAGRGHRRP